MPIIKQPLDNGEWVSAYRPLSFMFYQFAPVENIIIDIVFDGVVFATIRKPYVVNLNFFFNMRAFAIDIQQYAQDYLSPIAGVRSAASPNNVDINLNVPNTTKFDNVKHYCMCYVRARYEYLDTNTGRIKPVVGTNEQSATFRVCNATLQHYESFNVAQAPTQDLKPFYLNSNAPVKFLTNKKGDILCKKGTPQTISIIAKNLHVYQVETYNAQGVLIASGQTPIFPRTGPGGVQNFHARIGVSDVNINTVQQWLTPPPYPTINAAVAYWRVQLYEVIPILGFNIPIARTNTATMRYDNCNSSFQLDYMNPLGGFDSFIFSSATVTSKLGKKGTLNQRSLTKYGFTPPNWGTSEIGKFLTSIDLKDTFEVQANGVTVEQMKQLKELVASPEVYMQQNLQSIPIIIEPQETPAGGWDKLTNKFKFSFSFANDRIVQRF